MGKTKIERISDAIASDDVVSLNRLLRFSLLDLNDRNMGWSHTALGWALYHSSHKTVSYLLSKGVNVKQVVEYEETPLALASRKLVDCHAENQKSLWRDTIEKIISHGADLDVEDHRGFPIISILARGGEAGLISVMLNKSKIPALLLQQCSYRFLQKTPAFIALQNGQIECFEFLQRQASKKNCSLRFPKKLLDDIYVAAAKEDDKGALDYVKDVLSYEPSIAARRQAFFKALKNGKVEFCKNSLMSEYVDINVQDINGDTLLHYAVMQDNISLFNYAMGFKNLDVTLKGNDNNTAFHFAVNYGNLEMVEKLYHAGGALYQVNNNQQTPMELAKRSRNTEIVDFLRNKMGGDWRKISDKEVYFEEKKAGLNISIREIFNFKVNERTRVVKDLISGDISHETIPFKNVDRHMLSEAFNAYQGLGGKRSCGFIKQASQNFKIGTVANTAPFKQQRKG